MNTEREIFDEQFKECRARLVACLREGEQSRAVVCAMVDIIFKVCMQEDDAAHAIEEIEHTFRELRMGL